MVARDKHTPLAFFTKKQRTIAMIMFRLAMLIGTVATLASCNRMMTPRASQIVKDGDARAAEGDFLQAVNLYETALDGSVGTADTHYKLPLLYDDKMNEPFNAVHHFKRYL